MSGPPIERASAGPGDDQARMLDSKVSRRLVLNPQSFVIALMSGSRGVKTERPSARADFLVRRAEPEVPSR